VILTELSRDVSVERDFHQFTVDMSESDTDDQLPSTHNHHDYHKTTKPHNNNFALAKRLPQSSMTTLAAIASKMAMFSASVAPMDENDIEANYAHEHEVDTEFEVGWENADCIGRVFCSILVWPAQARHLYNP
jgi:hypothetical protein